MARAHRLAPAPVSSCAVPARAVPLQQLPCTSCLPPSPPTRTIPLQQLPCVSRSLPHPHSAPCRSRRAARALSPALVQQSSHPSSLSRPGLSRAVLAHHDGRISETSTANLAVVRGGEVATPPAGDALPGVSLGFARTLAAQLGIPWRERSLSAADLAQADEILLTSTPNCLLPATRFDGRPVCDGRPGPVARRLLAAWSQAVGIDIAAQARHHASAHPHTTNVSTP